MQKLIKKIVLGIDPGLASTGWGVIYEKNKKLKLLEFGCITTSADDPCGKRLQIITAELNKIIKKFKPQFISIEDIFFAKNVKTAMKVGQAKGAILLTIENSNTPVKEFTPLQIKQAVTGYGQADKLQMQKMIRLLLNLKSIPKPDDAADALAAAICFLQNKDFK